MDIVGIVLLFFCGAIGGKWIDKPMRVLALDQSDPDAYARNERWAFRGSWLGLLLAVTGFGLQLCAQWL